MSTGDSARFGPVLSGEATRGAAPVGAAPGRPRAGLADASTDLAGPASDPPLAIGAPPPHERTGDRDVGPDEDDDGAVPPAPTPGGDAFAEFDGAAIAAESTRIDDGDLLADQSTAILDEGPESSSVGHGKEYWAVALEALAKEVR